MVTTERDVSGRDEIEAEIDRLLVEIEGPEAATTQQEEPEVATPKAQRKATSPPRRTPRKGVRTISLRLAALLMILAVAGTAFAVTQTSLSTEFFELWQSQSQATDFTVTDFTFTPSGDNNVTIDLTLHNDDTIAHFANVTVQLLNSTGDVILEATQATGSVAGGADLPMTFNFSQTGLVADYEKSQIVVVQSS